MIERLENASMLIIAHKRVFTTFHRRGRRINRWYHVAWMKPTRKARL